MFWSSKKKNPGYSYFASGVTLEGRLCFQGIIRLDGRVRGEVISSGTLVVEEAALIKGNICVENIVLSGTVYGNIKASKQIHLNATAKVYGDLHYGELSIEGAIHEGNSHKLTAEEIEAVQAMCAAAIEPCDFMDDAEHQKNQTPLEPAVTRYVSSKNSGGDQDRRLAKSSLAKNTDSSKNLGENAEKKEVESPPSDKAATIATA
ncbi:MAG: polymer-forming cytoskeletal protein [Candidatus Adiutrix sp.]|jgi:cytoskeletal protein CcmA (bactofilin family)|nr:polymer-forming cytoskeletal protein [Candidatus Adiutrix sp.]